MRCFLSIFITLSILSGIFLSGCKEDDFSSGKNELTFSQDTLSFDTLFSGIGSTTAWLRIVNKGNEDFLLSQVRLESEGESGFRINLDGENKNVFNDIVIPANDSLFLFVELTSKLQNSDDPVLVEDAVVFESEFGQQKILLQAWCWDAVIWHGKVINSDTVLTAKKPYIVYDSLVVAENATLTMLEGVTMHMHDASRVVVRGTIKAKGSQSDPVTFRGDRLDYILTDFPYDYNPGQWHYIELAETSFNNEFDNVRIRGGYYGIVADSSSLEHPKMTMTNTVMHNFVYSCLWSLNSQISIANSELTNSGSYTVCIIGGKAEFTHCTIANYQERITREGPTLVIANYTVDSNKKEYQWPVQAAFRNCLIFGSMTEELGFAISGDESIFTDISFRNCLLKTKNDLGETATGCIYPEKPNFLKLGSEEDKYFYDFRVDSLSPARGKADIFYSALYPYDMNGVARSDEDGPDIGAYEFK